MPSHQKAATGGILHITVSHVLYPVTNEVLHQVLEAYDVEKMTMFERVNQVEAMVQLRSWKGAERARDALHGRCIYDRCCFLDVQLVQPTTEPASTKMARRDAVASVCAPEVVVEATCSSPPDKLKSEPLSLPTLGCEWDDMSDEQKRRYLNMVIEVKETLYNRLRWPLSSRASSDATAPEDSTDTTAGLDGVDVVPLSQGKEQPLDVLEVLEIVPMKTHGSSDDDKPPLVTAPTTTFAIGMEHSSLVGDGFTFFGRIRDNDWISWGSIIAGFAQQGCKMEAVQIFREMIAEGVHHPNVFHFGSVFSACGAMDSLEYGKQIHGLSVKYRLDRNSYAGCSLSDMYTRCKLLESARRVFYGIDAPDLVPWNSIKNACSVEGLFSDAMVLFSEMRDYGLRPDGISVRGLLCACVGCDALHHGRLIHSYLVKLGLDGNVSVCNSLVSMYARCMDFPSAMDVFHETKDCDVVTWNNILTACVQHQRLEVDFGALELSTPHQDEAVLAIDGHDNSWINYLLIPPMTWGEQLDELLEVYQEFIMPQCCAKVWVICMHAKHHCLRHPLVEAAMRMLFCLITRGQVDSTSLQQAACQVRSNSSQRSGGDGHFESVEQVTEAIKKIGRESCNLIVGVDFTRSNEWTGRISFGGRCLHDISGSPNPYQQVLVIINRTLSRFDEDGEIPFFGFGDASTHDHGVFSFYPDHRPCNGISEGQLRYEEIVLELQLSGPTSFAPVIEMAAGTVKRSGYYHVLLIIADGQVTGVNDSSDCLSFQEQKNVEAIVNASHFPLSTILVGVGDGPWNKMEAQHNHCLQTMLFVEAFGIDSNVFRVQLLRLRMLMQQKHSGDCVQVRLSIAVLLILWDPGGNDDGSSVSAWGQAEIQGGKNVTVLLMGCTGSNSGNGLGPSHKQEEWRCTNTPGWQ